MTANAWQIAGVIFTIVSGCIAIYFMQKQSANAAQELRQRAIDAATGPLLAQIAGLRSDVRDRDLRINQLEDQLRGGRNR